MKSKFVLIPSALALMISACGSGDGEGFAKTSGLRAEAAHAHGVGEMFLLVDGGKLEVSLEAPIANFTAADGSPVDITAAGALSDGTELFALPVVAGCTQTLGRSEITLAEGDHDHDHGHADEGHNHDASSEIIEDHADHEHGDDHEGEHGHDDHGHDEHKHDDHDHEKHDHEAHDHAEHSDDAHDHDADGHEDHKDHSDQEQEEHADHDHDEGGHKDVTLDYSFNCASPDRLEVVDLAIFEAFSGFDTINITLRNNGQEQYLAATPSASKIALK